MNEIARKLDIAPLIQFEEQRCSATLTLASVNTAVMKDGYAAKALHRLDCRFRRSDGQEHTTAFVQKFCKASEVRMVQELAANFSTPTLPQIVDAERCDDRPEDPTTNWFIYPFYEGRTLTFNEPVPDDVMTTLAVIHAQYADVAKYVDWTWTFDASHLEKTHHEAVEALATAETFHQTVPDHQEWQARLAALGRSSVLREATGSLPTTLTHGDMHPGNIIMTVDDRRIIIDWGNVCLAPPFLDLANIISIESLSWRVYRDACQKAGESISEETAKLGYFWARAATGMQYLPWIAHNTPDAPRMIAQVIEAEREIADMLS